jgi:hypothetical protein
MSDGTRIRLMIEVHVVDAKALTDYARKRYKACWEEDLEQSAGIGQAVLEALVISNENPTPSDYGIEINNYEAVVVSGFGGGEDGSESDDDRYTCECSFDDACECGCIACRNGDHSDPNAVTAENGYLCDGPGCENYANEEHHYSFTPPGAAMDHNGPLVFCSQTCDDAYEALRREREPEGDDE